MNKTTIRSLLGGFAAFAFALTPLSARDAEEAAFLPGETLFWLEISDFSALAQRAETSPLGQIFGHEKLLEYLSPLWAEMGEDFTQGPVEEGYWELFKEHLTGRAVFALIAPEDGDWDVDPKMVILVDFSGDEDDFARLLDPVSDRHLKDDKGLTVSIFEEDFMGQTLFIEEVVEDGKLLRRNGWAKVGERVILADPDSFLREVIAAVVDDGLRDSLRDSPAFQDAVFRSEGADIRLFLNLESVMPFLVSAMREGLEEMNEGLAASGSMPPVSVDGLVRALALETLTAIEMSVHLNEDASVLRGNIGFDPGRGIGRIFAYGSGEVPLWSGVPASAVAAAAANFSFAELYRYFMEVLGLANPGLAMMATMQMNQMQEHMGFHLGKDIFENMGSEIHSFSVADPEADDAGEPEQVFAVSVRDPARLTLALENLKNITGGAGFFEREDAGDVAVFRFQQPISQEMNRFISYAVTDQHLLVGVGREALLAGVLQETAEPFWERADIAALFDQHPGGAVARNFSDLQVVMGTVLDSLEAMSGAGLPSTLDSSLRPSASDFPFIYTSTSHRESNGFSFFSRVVPKSQID